jgi:hypothetical protein
MVINPWWAWLQIILTILGLLLGYIGNRFSIPFLFSAGILCLGLMVMVMGWEAMITRQIHLRQSRWSRQRASYSGLAAFLKGIQFNVLGFSFVVLAIVMYTNIDGRGVFLQMVRRPGLPLVFMGGLILLQAVITLAGSNEMRRGSQGTVMVNLFVSRLMPGIILLAVAALAIAAGLFEIAAPDLFDERGGGLLETLYGVR